MDGRGKTINPLVEGGILGLRNKHDQEAKKHGIKWEGEGVEEIGIRQDTGKVVIRIDKRYFRPTEVNYLQGNPSKANRLLNWKPRITLPEMVSEMVKEDIKNINDAKNNY